MREGLHDCDSPKDPINVSHQSIRGIGLSTCFQMNGSHHSVSSSQSIASEDMHAILSELTVKVPTGIEKGRCLPLENGLCSMEEEEGSATETEDRDRGCLKIARCSNNAEEDGNDTTDSGIKC